MVVAHGLSCSVAWDFGFGSSGFWFLRVLVPAFLECLLDSSASYNRVSDPCFLGVMGTRELRKTDFVMIHYDF